MRKTASLTRKSKLKRQLPRLKPGKKQPKLLRKLRRRKVRRKSTTMRRSTMLRRQALSLKAKLILILKRLISNYALSSVSCSKNVTK